jgi:hypothetical protein
MTALERIVSGPIFDCLTGSNTLQRRLGYAGAGGCSSFVTLSKV